VPDRGQRNEKKVLGFDSTFNFQSSRTNKGYLELTTFATADSSHGIGLSKVHKLLIDSLAQKASSKRAAAKWDLHNPPPHASVCPKRTFL
jgi:hypothetical protein